MTADDVGRSGATAQTLLLDRRAEQRTIHDTLTAFAAAPSARHGPLLFAGRLGLGKSTLLEMVRQEARELGLTHLDACGFPHAGRAYLMARQWFLAEARPLLLQPLERSVLGLETQGRLVDRGVNSILPALERADAFDALDALSSRVAYLRGPLVLLLDDAHWADRNSVDWLHRLLRQQPTAPVLAVLACSPEEPSPTERSLGELATLPGTVHRELRPLAFPAVRALAGTLLGEEPDAAFSSALYRATGGVPLSVVDTLRRAAAEGVRPTASAAGLIDQYAMTGIGQGLLPRLGRLGPAHLRMAQAVAVLGPNATLSTAGRLAGLPPARAAQSLDRLRDAMVLDPERVQFDHPLYAKAVYDAIPSGERGGLHARAARLLTDAGHGPEVAAVHVMAAPPDGDPWAVEQLRAAAARSLAAGAPEDADRLLARAQDEPPPSGLLADLHYERGVATYPIDPQQSAVHLRAALGDTGPHEAAVRLLAKALAHENRLAEAVGLLEKEYRRTGRPSSSRQRLMAECFLWSAFWEEEGDAGPRHRLLRRLCDRITTSTPETRRLLILRAWYATLRGEPVATALRAVRLGTAVGLVWTGDDGDFDCGVLAALVYLYCGRTRRAEEMLDAGIAELRGRNWSGGHLALARSSRALVLLHTGRLAAAQSESEHALDIAAGLRPMTHARWYALSTAISVLLARGKTAEAAELSARERFTEPFPSAVVLPAPRCVLAELRIAQGRTAEAEALLTAVRERQTARHAENPAGCPWQPLLALALRGRDREAARAHAWQAVERAREFGVPTATGTALIAAGIVAGGADGLPLLAEAVELLRSTDDAYAYARALTEYGDALRRTGRTTEAREVLRTARSVACQVGAEGLAERALAARRLAGGRERTPVGPGLEGLTERQVEVGALAAAGLTNRAIATRLNITAHTVSKHLTEIYKHLGVTRETLRDLPWPPVDPW
ncbi:AAA family ATPase [Streptomyces sp. NPDC000151]|uniref:ATP-binding protein n=1 Tax=Streptomyces sp. NPDC000151 TaxID=3154244 RepID=UPI003328D402